MKGRFILAILLVLALVHPGLAQDETTKKPDIKAFKPVPAHDFDGADGWLNTQRISIKDLRGRVVVIHFFTYGCINCVHNLPHYKKWQKEFAKEKFTIVGIHTPETEDEHKLDNVVRELKIKDITYPVIVDTSKTQWKKWNTRLWPTCAIIDKNGMLRYFWEGELNWKDQKGEEYMRGKIVELLAEKEKSTESDVK